MPLCSLCVFVSASERGTESVMDLIFLAIILEVIKGKESDLAAEVSVLTLCCPPSLGLISLMGGECTIWLRYSFFHHKTHKYLPIFQGLWPNVALDNGSLVLDPGQSS